MKNKNGEMLRMATNDQRILSGEYFGLTKGNVSKTKGLVRDENIRIRAKEATLKVMSSDAMRKKLSIAQKLTTSIKCSCLNCRKILSWTHLTRHNCNKMS